MKKEISISGLLSPNEEIRYIYRNSVLTWFQQKASQTDIEPFIQDLEKGDCESAGAFLSHQLLETISFYDYSESYYHGSFDRNFSMFQKNIVSIPTGNRAWEDRIL